MRRKFSFFFRICVFFGLIFRMGIVPFTVSGAEGINRNVTAGMPRNFPPDFFIEEESGSPAGFSVDVMDAVARRCGIKIRYAVFESWKAVNQAAKDGRIDIIPNMGFTSERQAFMDFTPPYETFRINYYIRSTSTSLKSTADIGNRKVGVVVTNKARFILEKTGQYNIVRVDTYENLAWKLIAGDVDCIAMPETVMNHLLWKSRLSDQITSLGDPLVEIKRGIAVVKGRTELFQLLQSTVEDFILSDDFRKIYTKWYGEPETYWTPKRIGMAGAVLLILTISVMAVWRYRFIIKMNKELEMTLRDRTQVIEESEKRYRQMFLDNQAVKIVVDPADGSLVEVNDAACRFYQYPRDQLLGMKISDINTLSPEKIQKEMDAAKNQNRNQFYFPHKLANGEIREVEVFSGPITVGGKTLLFSIIHDVSERKKAQRALQESESRLMEAQSIANFGNFEHDFHNDTLWWSDQTYKILGFPVADTPPNYDTFIMRLPDGDKEKLNYLVGRAQKYGEDYSLTYRYQIPEKGLKYINVQVQAVVDENGEPKGLKGTVHDVTEQKKTLQELNRSNRELEQFAYAASHDLREPLRSISGFLQLLEKKYQDQLDHHGVHYIQKAISASHRMNSMISGLLRLSRVATQGSSIVETDMNLLVSELLETLQPLITERNAQIRVHPLPRVLMDKDQIYNVLQNLIINGITYNDTDEPLVEIGCQDKCNTRCFFVKDNGIGISKNAHDRVFQLFQRLHTRQEYPGTGLGLALSKKIVERHGGEIWLESAPGGGSTFFFTLGATDEFKS